MRQRFHERVSTVRVRAGAGGVTIAHRRSEGESTTVWADGHPVTSYRSLWTTPDATDHLSPAVHRWLERLGRRYPRLTTRILARSRTIAVHDLDHGGGCRRDTSSHISVMVDGRCHAGGPAVRGRAWLTRAVADLDTAELEALVEQSVRDAAGAVDPWPWPGTQVQLPVVFAPGVGGTAFHEVVGHGLEAEPGRPTPAPGTRLGTDAVTVVDDPTQPRLWGSRRIDDEGIPGTPVILIRRGVVRAALHTRDTSPQSSSARRMDYRSRPLARMSNTYLAPGQDDPAAMLTGAAVLHCVEGGSAEVRPGSQDVVMRIRRAELRRNGEPVGRHRHLALYFTADRLLHGIDAVGADLAFRPGRCVKESQSVPVSHGAPTFRLAPVGITGPGH